MWGGGVGHTYRTHSGAPPLHAGIHKPDVILTHLRAYLQHEWARLLRDGGGSNRPKQWQLENGGRPPPDFTDPLVAVSYSPAVPPQPDSSSCGLFVLAETEFFCHAAPNLKQVQDPEVMGKYWCDKHNVSLMREHIRWVRGFAINNCPPPLTPLPYTLKSPVAAAGPSSWGSCTGRERRVAWPRQEESRRRPWPLQACWHPGEARDRAGRGGCRRRWRGRCRLRPARPRPSSGRRCGCSARTTPAGAARAYVSGVARAVRFDDVRATQMKHPRALMQGRAALPQAKRVFQRAGALNGAGVSLRRARSAWQAPPLTDWPTAVAPRPGRRCQE